MLPEPFSNVLRAYATLQSPKWINLADISFKALHEFLLECLLLNPHFKEYPPSPQYQASFWKWAIIRLEQLTSDPDEDEIDERIYTHQVGLLQELSSPSLGTSAPSPSFVTYLWPSEGVLDRPAYPGYANATLLESRTTVESGTTGLRTWSASLILAQYLLTHPAIVRDGTVLELGCGVGFLGIVAASLQLESENVQALWLTDVNEAVLSRCKDNLRLRCNRSYHHPKLNFRLLDWSDAMTSDTRSSVQDFMEEACPGLLLGADVVYDPSIIPPLVNVLVLALSPRKNGITPQAYIALTQRNEDTLAKFLHEAERYLLVETISTALVANNIFTGSTELGQAASSQIVKIFRMKARM